MKKLNILLFALAMTAMCGCSVISGIFKAGAAVALAMTAMCGCSVISGIFKAGAAVGIIAVIVVIGIIIWIISMFRGR
jgi:hypothetical protein